MFPLKILLIEYYPESIELFTFCKLKIPEIDKTMHKEANILSNSDKLVPFIEIITVFNSVHVDNHSHFAISPSARDDADFFRVFFPSIIPINNKKYHRMFYIFQ